MPAKFLAWIYKYTYVATGTTLQFHFLNCIHVEAQWDECAIFYYIFGVL